MFAVVGELVAAGATIGLFEWGVDMLRKLHITSRGSDRGARPAVGALRFSAVVILAVVAAVAVGSVPGVAVFELAAATAIAAGAAIVLLYSQRHRVPRLSRTLAPAAPFMLAANAAFVVAYLTMSV